jgi:hypothetical protein
MNEAEALKLCRYVKACCPQQAIDEFTPLAWADHLANVPYEDAKTACKQITAAQPFVTIAEVLKIVKQIRTKRIADAGDLTPPTGLTDAEERAWLGEARHQIADGLEVRPDHGELKQRYLPELRALMPKIEETP